MASFHRSELKHLYKTEADPDVMERLLLLVMKVEGDEMILARIAKELHRSRTWASDCLAKYKKEGVEGLKDIPMYPAELLKAFNDSDIFVPLSRDTRLIDYQNAQIILTGAREGRDVIKRDIGIEIIDEDETQQSADIFNKLNLRREQVPIRPLTEGKWE